MPVAFTETTVTIDGETIGTLDPDTRTTARCAWSPATIRWGYSDTMAEPEPSTLQLSITVPDGHPLPRYGQLIRIATKIRWTPETGPDIVWTYGGDIFIGQIDGAARRRVTLSAPRATPVVMGWAIDVTASGPIAKLGRTMLSDAPWPRQSPYARVSRILELLGPEWGVQYESASGPTGGTLRERDVDNFQALDAIRRAMAGQNMLLTEGSEPEPTVPYGIRFATPALPNVFRRAAAGGQVELSESVLVPHVPASVILDEPRDLDIGSVINSIAFRYESEEGTFGDWEYTTRTHVTKSTESIALYGESQWQTNSDAIAVSAPVAETLSRILDRRSQERWSLSGPVTIDMKRWTPAPITSMPFLPRLAWYFSAGVIIHIDDAPPDVDPQQRVIGGVVTLHGDPDKQRVQVYLEQPDATLGSGSITILQSSQILISETQNVTFNDARTVSDVELIG